MKLVILCCLLASQVLAVEWPKGRGAQVPFVEVEAEHAHHNGKVIGNSRLFNKLEAEASQRRAVTLDRAGQFVEFTLPIEANAMVIRYSIPDTNQGNFFKTKSFPIIKLRSRHRQ